MESGAQIKNHIITKNNYNKNSNNKSTVIIKVILNKINCIVSCKLA